MSEENKTSPYETFLKSHPKLITGTFAVLLILFAGTIILAWIGVLKINLKEGVIERTEISQQNTEQSSSCLLTISGLNNEIDSLFIHSILPVQYENLENSSQLIEIDKDIVRLCILKYSVLENKKLECRVNGTIEGFTDVKSKINQISKKYR
jgi:hypothetical protein